MGVRCHGAGLRGAHHGEILPPPDVGGGSSHSELARRLREAARHARRIRSPVIRRGSSQGRFARRDSQERLARHGRAPGFARRLDEQGMAARQVCDGSSRGGFTRRVRAPGFAITFTRDSSQSRPHAGFARRVREAAQRAKPTGHKKRRRSEERRPSPQNYGRKPDPP